VRSGRLHAPYADLAQQGHAARLGMWVVIASEILLFSALFALYAGYRMAEPDVIRAGARRTSLGLGTTMTYILVTSSFFVAMGVAALRRGVRRACVAWLLAAAASGVVFLGLKATEYHEHLAHGLAPGSHFAAADPTGGGLGLFFALYYVATGLHALHVLAGVIVLAILALGVWRGRWDAAYTAPVELGGLYWHLVDAIWLFLWPLFYLLR
jgi:cytochrome c oxidase subunit 3